MSETLEEVDNQNKSSSSNHELSISYNDIANKLLKDRFLLSALELHSELVECGKEIPKLKEFFSNPGNFENHFTRPDYGGMLRSSSQATLDSLDLTRYSEDGERGVDERVAVLEFELRKAKETITALRANLTVATECETPTGEPVQSQGTIKPHELRALNFLINEYLLQHNYKLTSITFADENENQDFEDWDDVGLNIPKPTELLQLYRDSMKHCAIGTGGTRDWGGQTCLPTVLEQEFELQMNVEIERLNNHISILEREKAELTASVERLSTVEPVVTHFAAVETVSTHSATPERFEMIESSRDNGGERPCDDTSSLNDTEWTRVNAPTDSEAGSACGRGEPAGTEDPPPWPPNMPLPASNDTSSNRCLPIGFQREVVNRCFVNTSRAAETLRLQELMNEGVGPQTLTQLLASALPKILPHVLSNRREDLIPLLVCTIQLHDEPSQRDALLQLLFNMKKRPQLEERRSIIAGVVSLARASQGVGEAELLPHCWEQMSHKHAEHRLLVAEACSALAPYISAGMRNSLVLSILQQLFVEDREEEVRACCINSLALVTSVMDDFDKYAKIEELTLTAIQDPGSEVAAVATQTLLPVLAQWAFQQSCLQDRLLSKLIDRLQHTLRSGDRANTSCAVLLVNAFRSLLPFLVLSVASVESVTSRIQPGLPPAEPRPGFAELCLGLANPALFYDGEFSLGSVMSAFDIAVQDSHWPELDWVLETMTPKLLDCLEIVDVTNEELLSVLIALFKSLAAGFGKNVTENMVKSVMSERLKGLESKLMSLQSEWPSLALIPVYLLSILAPIQSAASMTEIAATLQRFLSALALCAAPMDSLQVSVLQLCKAETLREPVMSALWEGVVHPRPIVRAATAGLLGHAVRSVGESMITNHIVPALITLASDPDISVKAATIPIFGTLIECSTNKEVGDKTYCQLQSLLNDPGIRDNHSALLQLISTLGHVVGHCDLWFRDDVVVPQLAGTAAYTLQLTNQSRRQDLATALVTAFSNSVYCSLSQQTITTALLPGLRYLEQICSQSLPNHHETVVSMIQEAESRTDTPTKPIERSSSSITLAMASSNVGQGVEDMKNRVTKIFQTPISRPTNLPNLQSINIFRKK